MISKEIVDQGGSLFEVSVNGRQLEHGTDGTECYRRVAIGKKIAVAVRFLANARTRM